MPTCSKCGKEIVWARSSATGALIPLDPKPIVFEVWQDGEDFVCVPVDSLAHGRGYAVTHFATCTHAAEFSGRSAKREKSEPADGDGAKGLAHYTDDDPFPFGKHRGTAFGDVPSGYLDWLRGQDWLASWPGILEYVNRGATGRAIDQDIRHQEEEPPTSGDDNIPF